MIMAKYAVKYKGVTRFVEADDHVAPPLVERYTRLLFVPNQMLLAPS